MFVGSFGVIVNTCGPGRTLGICDYSLLEDLAVEVLGLVLVQDQAFSSFAICVEDQALRVVIFVY